MRTDIMTKRCLSCLVAVGLVTVSIIMFDNLMCDNDETMESRKLVIHAAEPVEVGRAVVNTMAANKPRKHVLAEGRKEVYKDFPDITFYVRFTSSIPRILTSFYCVLFRTALFFWPTGYGKMVLVLDDNKTDHIFGQKFQKQIKEHYPELTVEIFYEGLPKNKVIEFPGQRNLGYNLQLWNEFFIDQYTNDSIIAYMDTDAQFRIPMTKEYLFGNKSKKLIVIGISPILKQNHKILVSWASSTEKALGVKVVGCFMTTFPQLLYRDTVTNTRKYIMNRFNTTDFGYALRQFFGPGIILSPINIIMHYAWYFEKDRYAWHMNMNNTKTINAGLPKKHRITAEDTIPTVIGMGHIPNKKYKQHLFTPGYCETMRAIGKPLLGCRNISHDLDTICEMIVIWPQLRPHWPDSMSTWCEEGNERDCCRKAINTHYRNVANIPGDLHIFNITKAKLVETLVKEYDLNVKCEPLKIP